MQVANDAKTRNEEMARAMRRILVFVFSVALIAVFVLWRIDNPRLERVRMAVADGLRPSMELTATPARFLSDMVSDYQKFTRVYAQNAELRREIQRLRAWREAAQQLEQENARLRALNKVRLAPSTGFTTGEIIADSGGPFLQTGLANVGYLDGVQDGAAVMDGSGLVGRVVGVGRHAARVLFVTDYSSRIPVELRPSGKRAIMSGDATPAPRLDFLDDPDGAAAGETVVTSGDGGVFAPGLPVGMAVVAPSGKPRVRLAADFDRLEFVRVLRYAPENEIDRPGALIDRRPPAGAGEDAPPPEAAAAPTEPTR